MCVGPAVFRGLVSLGSPSPLALTVLALYGQHKMNSMTSLQGLCLTMFGQNVFFNLTCPFFYHGFWFCVFLSVGMSVSLHLDVLLVLFFGSFSWACLFCAMLGFCFV